jgi:predicted transcriptional regulator
MTVAEVAATIGRTPKTVRLHIRTERLRAVQFEAGGPYSIHREDAQAWVASFVVGQQAREGLDRMVNGRRSGLAGAAWVARDAEEVAHDHVGVHRSRRSGPPRTA